MQGTLSRIQSDRGDQLIAAPTQMKERDFNGIQQWAGRNGIEWLLVPTAGQHFQRTGRKDDRHFEKTAS